MVSNGPPRRELLMKEHPLLAAHLLVSGAREPGRGQPLQGQQTQLHCENRRLLLAGCAHDVRIEVLIDTRSYPWRH
jgi:hypothetical protein